MSLASDLAATVLTVRVKKDLQTWAHVKKSPTYPEHHPMDYLIEQATILTMRMLENKPIYRLSINQSKVDVTCYDLLENFAPELDPVYTSVDGLPEWAKEKLAVLMVLDPTSINDPIEGVGRRINQTVFWITK